MFCVLDFFLDELYLYCPWVVIGFECIFPFLLQTWPCCRAAGMILVEVRSEDLSPGLVVPGESQPPASRHCRAGLGAAV